MASPRSSVYKIFSTANIDECRAVVKALQQENVIALGSVDVIKDWPLTLLAIGEAGGNVYLFDVLKNGMEPEATFFKDTGLDEVLTSSETLKVIHACKNESGALFYQFGVKLKNVFDTEVAHTVIREHKGRQFVDRANWRELCNIYVKKGGKYRQRDDLELQWNKKEGNFWAKRPLAQEKIDYACSRVSALIPKLYEEQKRYLEENRLTEIFAERVQEEIDYAIDPDQKERRGRRYFEKKKEVLSNIADLSLRGMQRTALNNRDMKFVLNGMTIEDIKCADNSELLLELKVTLLKWFLGPLEGKMKCPNTFYPTRGTLFKLNDITAHGTNELREHAARLKNQYLMIFADDLQKKYGADAHLTELSRTDLNILHTLRPLKDNWAYPNIVLEYNWRIIEEEIDKTMQNLAHDSEYEILNMHALMSYCRYYRAPVTIRKKVKNIVDDILKRLPLKYGLDSCANELNAAEKVVLDSIDVIGEEHTPIIVKLHWEVIYGLLCDKVKVFSGSRRWDWLKEKIEFLSSDDRVPDKIKRKAEECQKEYQQAT